MARQKKAQPKRQHRPNSSRSGAKASSTPQEFRTSDAEWREVLRHHFRRRRRQKIAGWCLLAIAALVALNHFLEHSDAFDVLKPVLSPGWQDLVAGFPVAIAIALAAVILLGQIEDPPKRERA
jgi:hypothetical protein